jgi:hypothetical protein
MDKKFKGFFGGYGTGKSETLANASILDAMLSPSALVGIYEPTYDLIRLIIAPRMQTKLSDYGINYKYNKSENVIYTSNGSMGDFIFRTLDNPERIIGYETFRSHIDELDVLKTDKAQEAWNKVIARNRQSIIGAEDESQENKVSTYSTPEGFKFCYNRWVRDGGDDYGYIQASTLSNPFLPSDYVQALRDTYSEKLIEAYINGQFVNLTTGTVYEYFKRTEHDTNQVIQEGEPLHIGQDFNIGGCCSAVCVERGNEMHCVDELQSHDTMQLIQNLKQRYPNNPITIYPDASGYAGKTNASISDNQMLINAGYELIAPRKNGLVKDRINSVNIMFSKKKLFVNTEKCVNITSALEQQAYDKNGSPEKHPGAATPDDWNDSLGYVVVRHQEQQAQGLVNLKMRVG